MQLDMEAAQQIIDNKAELEYKYILNPENYLINYGFGTTNISSK